MDGKYGRVYTEDDLRAVVQWAMERDLSDESELLEYLDSFEGRFPQSEPMFILRAQDRLARGTLHQYLDLCERAAARGHVPASHIDAVERTVNDFELFATTDANIKYPD